MLTKLIACGFWCAFCVTSSQLPAKGLTIPEAIERVRPGPFVTTRIAELNIETLERAIIDADVIVVGRVTGSRAYLSPDARTLYTDYTITPTRVIAAKESLVAPSAGLTQLVVRSWGGQTTISGVEVRITDSNFEALRSNGEYLLFLQKEPDVPKYRIFSDAYALEVGGNGRLKPITRTPGVMGQPLEGGTLTEVIQLISTLRR